MTFALGIDAGGTQTHWALVDSAGEIARERVHAGLTGFGGEGDALRALIAARMSGRELARLARIMTGRFGARPIAMRPLLPGTELELRQCRGHRAAARLALRPAR